MKIEVDLGVVTFPGITVGPQLSRQEFLHSTIGATATEGVVNDGWVTLHVELEPGICSSLIFKDDRLIQLTAMFAMQASNADEWDKKFEIQRKAKHDAWLRSELGSPPYSYSWGTVASEFDSKGCSSDIVITFGTFPVQKAWWERNQPT